MLYTIQNYYFRIKKALKWAILIFNDKFCEYDSLYTVIYEKIKDIDETLSNHKKHQINKILLLIDKVKNEYYLDEYMNYYNIELSYDKCDESSNLFKVNSNLLFDNSYEYFTKYPLTYKKIINQLDITKYDEGFDRNFVIGIHMARYRHGKAKRLLFKMIENNIESWWD
jgi:hypothetical protein